MTDVSSDEVWQQALLSEARAAAPTNQNWDAWLTRLPLKERERQSLAADVAQFLANGGKIQHVPIGITAAPEFAAQRFKNTDLLDEQIGFTRPTTATTDGDDNVD